MQKVESDVNHADKTNDGSTDVEKDVVVEHKNAHEDID